MVLQGVTVIIKWDRKQLPKVYKSATEVYYNVRQVLQSLADCYYKVCQVLQSVTGCYYKVRQVLKSVTVITKWDVALRWRIPKSMMSI